MHVHVVPNRGSSPTVLLRESYREGSKVCKRTLANLSDLSAAQIEAIRAALRGQPLQPTAQSLEITASRARAEAADAKVRQNHAMVKQAELNLEYTTVKAPIKGIVSRKGIEMGQVIQAGQPLMTIIPLDRVWVTANFKETQLENMRPGQRVRIEVDAYGGREFSGQIESLAAATGSRFSLLPPDNATGNYVKVVQRVPVRIQLDEGQDPEHLLRPGMSVVPTVYTR